MRIFLSVAFAIGLGVFAAYHADGPGSESATLVTNKSPWDDPDRFDKPAPRPAAVDQESVKLSAADPVKSAYVFCAVVDHTGLTSKPCEVSGWNSTVTITVDMEADEARSACPGMAGIMAQKGHPFGPGWKLQINSPVGPLAFCSLR